MADTHTGFARFCDGAWLPTGLVMRTRIYMLNEIFRVVSAVELTSAGRGG
jgi:hypothetical protein